MQRVAIRHCAWPFIVLAPVLAQCAWIAGLGDYSTGNDNADGNPPPINEGGPPDTAPPSGDASRDAAPDPKMKGLIAHVPFDEGSGTTAKDVTGNGHDVTLIGATWTSDGNGGSALWTSSLVPFHYYADQNFPSGKPFPQAAGTVIFVFKLDPGAAQRDESIFDNEDAARNHLYARMLSSGNMELALEFASSSNPDAGPPLVWSRTITNGIWTQVGISWDSQQPSIALRIGSSTWDVPPGVEPELSAFHPDGQVTRLLDDCHDCAMDELRVYDRFMSKDEMKSLFP